MSESVTIAVDAMGGDHGAGMTVPAVCGLLKADPGIRVVLTGRADAVEPLLAAEPHPEERLEFVACADTVAMDEVPADALRKKRDSSLRRAVDLVRDGHADACVSAGSRISSEYAKPVFSPLIARIPAPWSMPSTPSMTIPSSRLQDSWRDN